MAQVQETELPGVGVRYDFTTQSGVRLGVLVHRGGDRELLVYDADDPDSCRLNLRIGAAEARTLAEVLGVAPVAEHVGAIQQQVEGLGIDWLEVPDGSPTAGRTLAETAIHTRTGVSVVAILRGDETIPAPGADDRLAAGDTLVAAGTAEGLTQLASMLRPPR